MSLFTELSENYCKHYQTRLSYFEEMLAVRQCNGCAYMARLLDITGG